MIASENVATVETNEQREWAREILTLVRRLPSTERTVVTLSYFQGRSPDQISRELGLSPRAVSQAMAAALATIARATIPGST